MQEIEHLSLNKVPKGKPAPPRPVPINPVTGLPRTPECGIVVPRTKTLPSNCVCPDNKTWKAGASGLFRCQ